MNDKDIFNLARTLYPGSKLGNESEYANFIWRSKHPLPGKAMFNAKEVLPRLLVAVKAQIQWRADCNGEFRPEWKHFQAWINNRWWEMELPKSKFICWKCSKPSTRYTSVKGKDTYFCSDEHKPEFIR